MTGRSARRRRQRGFSLVELIIVIMILGVLSASVGVFLSNPIRAYFETIDRASLAASGNQVVRRITRELQAAVPNSARITTSGTTTFLEYVPIVDAGRYRYAVSAGNDPTGTNPLVVTSAADSSFQVLGPAVNVPSGSQLVVWNLGIGQANLYTGTNIRNITSSGSALQTINFTATTTWPGDSPGYRFYVVNGAATYACTPGAGGTGRLVRYYGYPIQASQPASLAAAPLSTATSSLVLANVSACTFTPGAVSVDLNAVQITLQLADSNGESVTLYSQAHTPNSP